MAMPAPSRRRWNYPFLLLLFLETAVLTGMAWLHRVPREHDGFGYFGMQYYFLNNVASAGELPQWIPYMMQGTVATWWYAVQAGIFVNSLAWIAGPFDALKGMNFLPFFYLGIFFDVLVLLVGTWLLARRLFRSAATAFFVCVVVVGPCIWMSQPWFNFRLYYALPLILALVHRFLDRSSWLSLLLAANLLALQTVGNLAYYIPVTGLVIALYFGFYTAFNWQTQVAAVRRLRFGYPAVLTILLGLGGLAASFLILRLGAAEIANYSPGRDADSRVSLDTFLTYGGEITRRKWAEPLLGISPSLDNTLYMGLLTAPLLAAGFCLALRRRYTHIHFLCAFLVLFGLGGFVSTEAYHWWPFMKYFRHIGLTGSLTRIFLCFVAGCGFEAVFVEGWTKRRQQVATVLLATGLLVLAVGLFSLAAHPSAAERVLRAMHTQTPTSLYANPPTCHVIFEPRILCGRLFVSGCIALLCSALLSSRGLLANWRAQKFLTSAALALVVADVYVYKCGETWLRTTSLASEDMGLLDFQRLPYHPRRSLTLFAPNPRVDALERDFNFRGIHHWSTSPFAFVDEVGSTFRVDYWMLPLDRLLRVWQGQDIGDRNVPPAGLRQGAGLDFPQHEAALKLAGVTEDKIQFFRQAQIVSDEAEIAARMAGPHYGGNVLFVSPGDPSVRLEGSSTAPSRFEVTARYDEMSQSDADDRVELEYQVERFDSNNLVLTVQNTTGSPVWLLFSDVWHPGWSATVNGRDVPLYRGALAYKAVQLPPQSSRVHFRFAVRGVSALYFFFSLCSTLWLGILAVLVTRTSSRLTENTNTAEDLKPNFC